MRGRGLGRRGFCAVGLLVVYLLRIGGCRVGGSHKAKHGLLKGCLLL